MPEYRLSLDFTAADAAQAERLAEAWAGTCAAEYGTRFAGVERLPTRQDKLDQAVRDHLDEQHLDPSASESSTAFEGDDRG